jgi:hypothetical protein
MPGPAPKPESKRRRYAKPKSYGAADPTTAPAAHPSTDGRKLDIDNPHPLIAGIWETVQSSCEAAFYSDGDWQRLRLELWFANHTMCSGRPSGQDWAAIQRPCVDQDRRPNPGQHRQLLQPN